MLRRIARRVGVPALVGVMALSATGGLALQSTPPAFPPGTWEGSVAFTGSFESFGVRSDGTDYASGTAVTDSAINFEMVVDRDGTILSGTMNVNIGWALSGNGTTPVNENQYFVTSEQRQAGTLDLQGTGTSMEAAGTLAHDTTVYDTSGNLIEEVSGTEETSVLWTFQPGTADCASVTGELVAAEGISLMQTALVPDFIFEDDYEAANHLVSQFWAYPVFEDSDLIAAAITELNVLLGEVLQGNPDPETILALVEAAEKIRADLARLDICNDAIPGFSPQQSKTWLADILTELLGRVLQESGAYSPQDLISLLNIGARGGVLTGDTYTGFGEALGTALSNAQAVDDIDSMYDIAVAAAQYGYQTVYEDAIAIIEGYAE